MKLSDIVFYPFAWVISLLWSQKEEEGTQGEDMHYQRWLDKYGYEAQYQAYLESHGTPEGFVYKDPGVMPSDWRG